MIQIKTKNEFPCIQQTVNVSNTKLIIFGTSAKLHNMIHSPIYLCDEVIERVQVFKYVGLLLDENLNFKMHINKLIYIYIYIYGAYL